MYWQNLKTNKCPKCAKGLGFNPTTKLIGCKCGFRISIPKAEEVIAKINEKGFVDLPETEDEFSDIL